MRKQIYANHAIKIVKLVNVIFQMMKIIVMNAKIKSILFLQQQIVQLNCLVNVNKRFL